MFARTKICCSLISVWAALAFLACAEHQFKDDHPESGFNLPTEDEEKRFGNYVDASIQQDFMVLTPEENPKAFKRIQEIGNSLAVKSDRPNLNYIFKILNTDIVNAFAGPGGYVYITTGLLEFSKNRDEIAGVLAHEIGHISSRHVVKQFRNMSYAQTLLLPIIIGTNSYGYSAIGDLSQITAVFFLMGYSRSFERQADYLSTKYMFKAGYSPEGTVNFLQRLWETKEKRKKAGIEVFFQTHPDTQDRIRDITSYIQEMKGIPK